MYPPDPDGEGPVHEGDNGLHLLEPEAPEVPPAQTRHVVDDGEPRHLGLDLLLYYYYYYCYDYLCHHLSGRKLQQHVGGGIEIFKFH